MNRPIGEDCDSARTEWPVDDTWARGILKIHEGCEPPCVRKQRALDYFAQTSSR